MHASSTKVNVCLFYVIVSKLFDKIIWDQWRDSTYYPLYPVFIIISNFELRANGSSASFGPLTRSAAWTLVRCWVVLVGPFFRPYIYNIFVSFSLECAKGMHLYDGRCYRRCPVGTYASEILTERSSRRRNFTYLESGGSSAVIKRQDILKPTASEALDMEPTANYSKSPLICLPCHYTCATCTGPHNSQCSSCLDDAQLFNMTDVEPKFYCYPNTVLPQIDKANWHSKVNLILTISLILVCCVCFCILIGCSLKRMGYCCGNNYDSNIRIAYNKLAVDDKQQSAIEIEEEITKALNKYSSESESEDDINL